MNQFSYWEHDVFFKPVDLCVIGAGIVGLSAAYFAKVKHPDWRILVLERGFLPSGASTKNAGFACFGSPTELLDDAKTEHENEIIERIKWRWDGLSILRNTLGDKHLQYEPCGGYEVFEKTGEMQESVDKLAQLNRWMEEATNEKNVFEVKSVNHKPAIFSRIEGAIHSGFMMKRWLELNQELGNEIRFQTEVESVDSGVISLKNGIEIKAKQILIATNGFSKGLVDVPIKPARGLVFVTKPIPNLKWKGVFHYDEGYVYFRNIGNRFLMGGGRNKAFKDEETTEFGENQRIKEYLIDLSNNLLDIDLESQIEFSWSGIMGFSDTKSPVQKEIKPNVHIRAGLGGMGVAIGSAIGKKFAEEV